LLVLRTTTPAVSHASRLLNNVTCGLHAIRNPTRTTVLSEQLQAKPILFSSRFRR
jgi:hypothetical protein